MLLIHHFSRCFKYSSLALLVYVVPGVAQQSLGTPSLSGLQASQLLPSGALSTITRKPEQGAPVTGTLLDNAPAPLFSLPDIGVTPQDLWSLRERLGDSSVLLIVAPAYSKAHSDTPFMQEWEQQLHSSETIQKLTTSQLQIASVLSSPSVPKSPRATGTTLPATGQQVLSAAQTQPQRVLQQINTGRRQGIVSTQIPLLLDAEGTVSRSLGATETNGSVVLLDRAGFVRHVEAIQDASLLSTRLQSLAETIQRLTRNGSDITPLPLVGQIAPDFTISDMNGQVQRLSDRRGKKHLLLTFFPKCFTGGCRTHLTSLQAQHEALTAEDVDILAVSVDPAEGERGQLAFAKSLGLSFPLIPDTGRNLSILYGAAVSPEQLSSRISVLIDKEGVVRWVDKQIEVKTHGADVLAKLKELGLSKPVPLESHPPK
ncbi:MAG TPA: peroxiredoxin family protein [Abditibacteriaceae bacterium]|jgi:peroxiredoxin